MRVDPDIQDTALPPGVELYRLRSDGVLARTGDAPDMLRFVDDGQLAHYLIGDEHSGPAAPSPATVKIGIVGAHSAFRPHVHGAEHVVLSLGSASCTLTAGGPPLRLALPPGCLLRIPAWLPHTFGNRAGRPLLIVAANTGLGIADDDYAVCTDEARRRSGDDRRWAAVVDQLSALQDAGPGRAGVGDRIAAALRRTAERLERTGPR